MKCPFCQSAESKVVDSRSVARNATIRRRRECLACERRFTTYEYVTTHPLLVVKKDGRRVDYDRSRVEKSIRIACNKRPVSADEIMATVSHIHGQLEGLGKAEITSSQVGDLVMASLKELDQVAYVRYASVYRAFKDIGEFQTEIAQLKTNEPASGSGG